MIFKYFNHVQNLPENSLVKQSLLILKSLFENHKICYYSNLYKILNSYQIYDSRCLDTTLANLTLKHYHEKMKAEYFNIWKLNLKNSRKLAFYHSFKVTYETEKYLDFIKNFDQRRQFSKFRISNHKLAIEIGRYEKQEIDQRLCIFCNCNEIETEEHMFLYCPFYSRLRLDFLQKIQVNIQNIDLNTNFIHKLLNSKNQMEIFYTSKFISKCFQLRDSKTQENHMNSFKT